MFDDKKYENLDEISRLVEPMVWSVNQDLSKMPDVYEVPGSFLLESVREWRISKSEILREACQVFFGRKNALDEVSGHFVLSSDADDNTIIVNGHSKEITGKLLLIKEKGPLEDEKLYKTQVQFLIDNLYGDLLRCKNHGRGRLNEIADIFDMKSVRGNRGMRDKTRRFITELKEQMIDLKVNIRDVDLMFRFGRWMKAYTNKGSLAAIKNICKLKVMTHKKRGIYSIQDEDVV